MPLVRISLIKGRPRSYIRSISEGIQRALSQAYEAPEDDKFQIIQQHERDDFVYDADYMGIHRTDDLVIVHIVASNWRDTGKKKALYRAITDNLVRGAGLRAEDVLIVISPNSKEDWSFGKGIASYVNENE